MKQWTIYKHISIDSNKVYVGLTKNSIAHRWQQHLYDARGSCSNSHFHRAIRKYGEDKWTHEVIVSGISTFEEACKLEVYYINLLEAYTSGYNLTRGGEGVNGSWSEETKAKVDSTKPMYTFVHYTHGEVTMTNKQFSTLYKVSTGNLACLLQGTRPHCKGWQLPPSDGVIINYDYPTTAHDFYHEEYGTVHSSCKELADMYDINTYKLERLVTGAAKKAYGWTLLHNKGVSPFKGTSEILRKFVHIDGTVYEGSITNMCEVYDVVVSGLSSISTGKAKLYKGWSYICDLKDLKKETK